MRAACFIFLFAATGSLIRLSRRDFDLFPVLAPLDFHGTSTNVLVCAGMPFVAFCFKDVIGFSYYVKTAIGTAVGLSIYELVQIYLPSRTFDPHDIVASFLGAIFSILLASILFLMQRTNYNTIVRSKNDNAV
jgi:VanZ family protein